MVAAVLDLRGPGERETRFQKFLEGLQPEEILSPAHILNMRLSSRGRGREVAGPLPLVFPNRGK